MTSPSDLPVDGIHPTDPSDSIKNPLASPPATPKAKVLARNGKPNGYPKENKAAENNGNISESSGNGHLSPPSTSLATTTSPADVMQQVPANGSHSIETQHERRELHNGDEGPSNHKRDLYVGNL